MAISPTDNSDIAPSSSLPMRIGTGVIGAIVLFFVARWILGFVFTLVKFGIFIALVVGAFYLYSQFTKKE